MINCKLTGCRCNVIEYVSYCGLLWWHFCNCYSNFDRLISTWSVSLANKFVSGLRDVTELSWTRLESGKQCCLHRAIEWQTGTQRNNVQLFIGVYHHPHRTHDLRSGSEDHRASENSVQKTVYCNSTSNAPDDGRKYPKDVELRIHQ